MPTDLDAGIIAQRVRGLVEIYGARLAQRGKDDAERRASNAFCALCVATLLDLDLDEAVATLTDGGQDGGVDAIHIADLRDDKPTVTLFQSKYEQKTLAGRHAFPASEIPKLIETIRTIFDPNKPLAKMKDIEAVVEEIRSRMREGAIPVVRVVLCNNGPRWGADGDARIVAAALPEEEVKWEHLNHQRLVSLLRSQKSIDAMLDFDGAAHHEDVSFRRVFVGKVPVATIADLMNAHGDALLDRNIRRFLGVSNRVNSRIAQTLLSPTDRANFYFYNNGLTMICRKLSFSSLRQAHFQVKVEGLQIINGGQTCKTIQQVLGEGLDRETYSDTFVMVRLYQLDAGDDQFGHAITYATNDQTPVELQDLRANDEIQQRLALDLAGLGYVYKTKRDNHPADEKTITSKQAAIAVLTVLRRKPHLARFAEGRLFDAYYRQIFTRDLNGAHVALATRIFADVGTMLAKEAKREPFWSYATHYVAMVCGELLRWGTEPLHERETVIDHRNLGIVLQAWNDQQVMLIGAALALVKTSLAKLGVDESSSLQRVAAQFRRSDLLDVVMQSLAARVAARRTDG